MGCSQLTIFEDSANFMARVEGLDVKPDVFFLDIHVRPHDGFAMLKMLREHPDYRDAKVIALTASVMNEEVEELRLAGFDGGIAKPIDQNVFPDLVALILKGERVWHVL
jgi:CheY-like chemotaxis protein